MKKQDLITNIEKTTQNKISEFRVVENSYLDNVNLKKYHASYQVKGKFKSFVIAVENEGTDQEKAYDIDGLNYDFIDSLNSKIQEKVSSGNFLSVKIDNILHNEKVAYLSCFMDVNGTKFSEVKHLAIEINGIIEIKEQI